MLKLAKRAGTRNQKIGSTGPRAGLEAQLETKPGRRDHHRSILATVEMTPAALSNCQSSGTPPRAF